VPDFQCIAANDLTADQIAAWRRIRAADASFDSGYFSPEFALAVAKYRDDVKVAVLREREKDVGFFPFHLRRFVLAQAVGSLLSDFHGAVVEPGVTWDWSRLLHSCGLASFGYDHLIESQARHGISTNVASISPYIETHHDFETYIDKVRSKTGEISQTQRKTRKAEREIGPVRFVYDAADPLAWDALLAWKTAQYQRTGATNPFLLTWADKLLKDLSQRDSPDLKGIVSCLYFGERLVAVHFGFCSGNVLHWWFPAYDTEMGKYSPGMILLLETIRAAYLQGVKRIDLGKGLERYKLALMTGSRTLYAGSMDANWLVHSLRRNYGSLKKKALSSSAGKAAKTLIKRLGAGYR
jgi:CelD/BcsL family acetyltransferase involved in cellulose biosynthesis